MPVVLFLSLLVFGSAFPRIGQAGSSFINSDSSFIIEDSQNHLATLPPRGLLVDFASAFQCGARVSYFVQTGKCKVHCQFHLCEEQCDWPQKVQTEFTAEECSADSVAVYSTHGHELLATRADYISASNSVALTLIKSISWFYDDLEKIKVDQVIYPVRKNFIENGEMKTVMLTFIALSLYPDKSKEDSFGMMLGLDLNQSGFHQIMCLASHGMCDPGQDYIMKRKGLVNAVP